MKYRFPLRQTSDLTGNRFLRGGNELAYGSHERPNEGATDVWLTPPEIIDALGPFDLDPCAAPDPRTWPTARVHYDITQGQDGLQLPWDGLVWCNPPYGSQVWTWLDRLASHGSGIALIFARTETRNFFTQVWNKADAVFFLYKRLNFYRPDGTKGPGNAGAPSALIAYGKEACDRIEKSDLQGSLVYSWRVKGC